MRCKKTRSFGEIACAAIDGIEIGPVSGDADLDVEVTRDDAHAEVVRIRIEPMRGGNERIVLDGSSAMSPLKRALFDAIAEAVMREHEQDVLAEAQRDRILGLADYWRAMMP